MPIERDHVLFESHAEVLPGVTYGRPEWVPSPAFWASLAAQGGSDADRYVSPEGSALIEDVVFCLLGGYGIKMEVNRAAWSRLKEAGIFTQKQLPTQYELEELLIEPLDVSGRPIRYRFPYQRARRLAEVFNLFEELNIDGLCGQLLRNELMCLPGIGPKTASWIVRNWAGSDDVAILDVHVIRACKIIGLFPEKIRLPHDYCALEGRFLDFAQALQIRPSLLDAIMWREMRILST